MRVFMTGASGWIGSAVVPELLAAGHSVVGLARSDESAKALETAGVEVRRGDLEDVEVLRAAAEDSDGVIHLAFLHDFSNYTHSIEVDERAVGAFGAALAGTGKPLLIAGGLLGLGGGDRVATERDMHAVGMPRATAAAATLALANNGVRSMVVRFAPTVHGEGDEGFIKILADAARQHGVSGYVGDGTNHWPAVHRSDAAHLVALAFEHAPAGSVLHGCAEEGIETRVIAEAIGRQLGVPTASIDADRAIEHFGFVGRVMGMDARTSNTLTRELLGWDPSGPTLIDDIDAGNYT